MNEQNNQEANHQQSTLENSVAAESLTDLTVADAEQSEITGGSNKLFVGGLSNQDCINHNETVAEDDVTETEALVDLPVDDTEQVKGGTGGGRGGDWLANHNETVAEDDVTETEALADLPLTTAQADATKAGDGTSASRREFPYIVSF